MNTGPDPTESRPSASLNSGSVRRTVGGVVAVLVAGRDHQHPEADDIGDRMHGAGGITRIVDAGGQTIGDFEAALDLAQNQQTAVGRQPAAVEPGDDLFAGNR